MEWESKFVLLILILVVGGITSYILLFGGIMLESQQSDFYLPTVTGENISSYKASCSQLDISTALNDPSSLNGKKFKIVGNILKKQENFDNTTDVQLLIPDFEPYIVITYSNPIPYEKGDKIAAYGEYIGDIAINNDPVPKTVPSFKAAYIEKI